MNTMSRYQDEIFATPEHVTRTFTSALDEAYDGLGLKDFEIEFLRQRSTKRFSTPAASRASASGDRLD